MLCHCDQDRIPRGATLLGIAFKTSWVVNNCVCNIRNALVTRHLAAFPYPIDMLPGEPYIYSETARAELKTYFCEHLRIGAWRKNKNLAKQVMIEQSIAYDQPKTSWVKSHIKTELALNYPKKARLIQGFLSLRDSYEFADEYRAFTEALVQWARIPRNYFGMYVEMVSACGMNRLQISKLVSNWILENPLKANVQLFIDDLSNMDGSVQAAHLDPHYDLLEYLDPYLGRHARASFKFKGMAKHKQGLVFYTGMATVKSGAQDTSSGQTCRRIECFVRTCKLIGCVSIKGIAFGDDIWVIIEGNVTAEQIDLMQRQFGWKSKGTFVSCVEQSDFLASSFVPLLTGGYTMVPLIGRQLSKLFWTWRNVPPMLRGSYCYQVAEAFLPCYEGFSFMERWLHWHMSIQVKHHFKMQRPEEPVWVSEGPKDWPLFIGRRYGLPMPPAELCLLINSVPASCTAIIDHNWTYHVMKYDLADPAERPLL